MSNVTTSYGTWCNQVTPYSTSPDADVVDFVGQGDSEWRELLEKSGALADIQAAYREKINEALPSRVALCGDEFIGPHQPDDDFDDYPTKENGALDIAACVKGIALAAIVEYYDPLTLEDIGRDVMKSTAKEPAKAASRTMNRLGVKAFWHGPNPDSGRIQSYYRGGEVEAALAARPGKGNRSERTAA